MKAGCDFLVYCCVREHVTCQLFDRELIERHIILKCIDHPIAVGPYRSHLVFFVTVGICIASQVQPFTSPTFAIVRRLQQIVYDFLVGSLGRVGRELIRGLKR